jgi:hypothetical protein
MYTDVWWCIFRVYDVYFRVYDVYLGFRVIWQSAYIIIHRAIFWLDKSGRNRWCMLMYVWVWWCMLSNCYQNVMGLLNRLMYVDVWQCMSMYFICHDGGPLAGKHTSSYINIHHFWTWKCGRRFPGNTSLYIIIHQQIRTHDVCWCIFGCLCWIYINIHWHTSTYIGDVFVFFLPVLDDKRYPLWIALSP